VGSLWLLDPDPQKTRLQLLSSRSAEHICPAVDPCESSNDVVGDSIFFFREGSREPLLFPLRVVHGLMIMMTLSPRSSSPCSMGMW